MHGAIEALHDERGFTYFGDAGWASGWFILEVYPGIGKARWELLVEGTAGDRNAPTRPCKGCSRITSLDADVGWIGARLQLI
jgi:hypothetical protein